MFTRTEAIDFATEKGLTGTNFVYHRVGIIRVFWQGDCVADSKVESSSRLGLLLMGKGEGWFVSAKVAGAWYWYFSGGEVVPHNVSS